MPFGPHEVLQDRYEIIKSLKSGGMGAVYEARDKKLADTPCAIKEVLPEALQGPDAHYILQSFETEMRALATLEHTNIPRVRDFFTLGDSRYIVMDLVQGQSLEEELAEQRQVTGQPMDAQMAALDMVGVLETLHYLHCQKPPVIHRDVKPANLIRDRRSGKIKLVDFGIARPLDDATTQTQVGTLGFCAPEQLSGRAEQRSDVFSVAATLYELCTGERPPRFAVEPLEPQLPDHPGLVEIIRKGSAPRAQDRYGTALEMADALTRWLKGPKMSGWLQGPGLATPGPHFIPPAPPAPPPPPPPPPTARSQPPAPETSLPSRNEGPLYAVVGLLLLLIGGFFWWVRSRDLATQVADLHRPVEHVEMPKPPPQPKPTRPKPANHPVLASRPVVRPRPRIRQPVAEAPPVVPRLPDAAYPSANGYPQRQPQFQQPSVGSQPVGLPDHPAEILRISLGDREAVLRRFDFPGYTKQQILELVRHRFADLPEPRDREGGLCSHRSANGRFHGVHINDGQLFDISTTGGDLSEAEVERLDVHLVPHRPL